MSLRRPSPKSAALMLLISAGIVLGVVMIFRGAGSPVEPARAVMPGSANLEFPQPGRYIVMAEQVISPRPVRESRLSPPRLELVLTENLLADIRGAQIPVEQAGGLDWVYKVLARGHGRTFGHVHIEKPGTYRLEAFPARDATEGEHRGSVVLAFARPALPGRLLWLLLGFGGQIVFSMRFLIQWLASEKAGRSVIPRAFWYLSLAGGLMILAYAAYTRDPVFILGYAPSTLIYVRNLVLLGREEASKATAGGAGVRDEERP